VSLIDQRILIVATVEVVWVYISDPPLVTKWHNGCKLISVLTTRSTGAGTRRRCVDTNGRAVVEETTAWFENIGCEYVVVDGPYRDFRGRFRLQAIPEGTIVNWTVEYHLRGLLAGLRNLLSFRRHYEDLMAESLRSLRRLVEASGVQLEPEAHARFAMQRAPSVEARIARSAEPTRPGGTKPASSALRPVAVGDDDLPELPVERADRVAGMAGPTLFRPQPAPPEVEASPAPEYQPATPGAAAQAAEGAPAAPASDLQDTKPRPPQGLREALAARRKESQPDNEEVEPAARLKAQSASTVPISLVAPPYEPPPPQETQTVEIVPPSTLPEYELPVEFPQSGGSVEIVEPEISLEDTASRERVAAPAEESEAVPDLSLPPPTSKRDTGEMSIWDVFGLERPSERTQAELEAMIASLQPRNSTDGTLFGNRGRAWKGTRRKAKPRVRGFSASCLPRQKVTVRVRAAKGPSGTPRR
jgi:hypothetical protein